MAQCMQIGALNCVLIRQENIRFVSGYYPLIFENYPALPSETETRPGYVSAPRWIQEMEEG